jgi:alkylation response protein AidB-like acyl-CoA dehydrogenase
MLITEAEAGSNLAGLKTTARKNKDGTYSLSGNKIFISGGDHDLTGNIIHMVLARTEGAPGGSRGVSLFIVPKILLDGNGEMAAQNDIVCTGIEKKMGLHGSPTCSMALGSEGNCIGTLVGEENQGLAIMFLMMNKARLMVGSQGHACASAAYLYALEYAKERIQGPLISNPGNGNVAIIQHPDIRRMLITMKAYTEGCRSLLCYVADLGDRKNLDAAGLSKTECQDLIDILIPIAKAYVTDRSVEVCNLAVQVLGGCGYTKEFPVEQCLRDVRVTSIYEGTNGIQAIDLLGRKMTMAGGRLFRTLAGEIAKTIENAKECGHLDKEGSMLAMVLHKLGQTAEQIMPTRDDYNPLVSFSYASQFLDALGDVVMAWMLLWRSSIAQNRLKDELGQKQTGFYTAQQKTAQFFFNTLLPVTLGKIEAIQNYDGAAIEIPDNAF